MAKKENTWQKEENTWQIKKTIEKKRKLVANKENMLRSDDFRVTYYLAYGIQNSNCPVINLWMCYLEFLCVLVLLMYVVFFLMLLC